MSSPARRKYSQCGLHRVTNSTLPLSFLILSLGYSSPQRATQRKKFQSPLTDALWVALGSRPSPRSVLRTSCRFALQLSRLQPHPLCCVLCSRTLPEEQD